MQTDPAVATVIGFTGTRSLNSANIYVGLKPLAQRKLSADQVVQRLRPKLNRVSGARLYLQAVQDLHIGGRISAAEYQYTLTSEDTAALYSWTPKLLTELGKYPTEIVDENSDLQQHGLQTYINIARGTAMRYGFEPNQIDNVLYDAYGQRTVTTIFNPFNQYYVVMEVDPQYWQYPQMLDRTYLSTAAGNPSGTTQTQMPPGTVSGLPPVAAISATQAAASSSNSLNGNAEANALTNSISNSRGGSSTGSADSTAAETMVPLPAMITYVNNHTATQVNHQGGLVASTISFNLPPGSSLSRAQATITQAMHDLGMPASIHGSPAGAGQVFAQNVTSLPLLLLAAFGTIYIVLGVLYENTVHPVTILSTLPSAMIGAILALLIFGTPLSVIAFIGIILLVGIVKKNAIMMIDVALHMQREEHKEAQVAIHDAAVIRLRPIMMTTAAAALGALPLAIGIGQGASLRQPLGITVIGGLILSQVFTLYTTPVIYLGFERLRLRMRAGFAGASRSGGQSAGATP